MGLIDEQDLQDTAVEAPREEVIGLDLPEACNTSDSQEPSKSSDVDLRTVEGSNSEGEAVNDGGHHNNDDDNAESTESFEFANGSDEESWDSLSGGFY